MRELGIEEQKSIYGGTTWQFTDYTANRDYASTDLKELREHRARLKREGHDVSGIERLDD